MTVNKAILLGRLGQDPELRHTGSGNAVCNFTIATNESWLDKQANERKEKTTWHNIVVWGASGENCAKYLSKGSKAYVEGRIQTREWNDKDGNKRYTTEIVANSVQFLDSKGGGGSSGGSNAPTGGGGSGGGGFGDDEIPF
jgi:single-strand DNA-binding protein